MNRPLRWLGALLLVALHALAGALDHDAEQTTQRIVAERDARVAAQSARLARGPRP